MRPLYLFIEPIKIGRKTSKVEVVRHEGYRTIIVNGVFGGHRPGYFEAVVHTDEMIADESLSIIPPDPEKMYIRRVLQCRLVMDPVQAKSLMEWLSRHISEYEKMFGKIVKPEGVKEEKPPPSTII